MGVSRPWTVKNALLLVVAFASSALISPARADDLRKPKDLTVSSVLEKPAPENIDDLKAIQKQVHVVLEKVVPCTVGLRIGSAAGSGVIITEDGYVLTAAHVSGEPDREVVILLPDGKKVKGKTLGHNTGIDSGLIKITTEGKWPHVDMGHSADLKKGTWCLTVGHPGGYQEGRSPPVRLGRIQENSDSVIRTDCTLVGGDSGGPLFDMDGNVIGIHSRIGGTLSSNYHVPIDTFRDSWDRLVASETWNEKRSGTTAYLGIQSEGKECTVSKVVSDSPAEKAGIKVDDIIKRFDGQKVADFDDLGNFLTKKKPGDKIKLEVQRGDETMTLEVVLGKRKG